MTAPPHNRTPHLELHLRKLEYQVSSSFSDFSKRQVALCGCLQGGIVERNIIPQHCMCLVERAVAIILAHTVLLQEIFLEHSCNLESDLVVLAKCALANELNDLRKVFFLLKDFFCTHAELHETWCVALVMGFEHFGVLRVRQTPINRWKMFTLCQFLIKAPEDLDDSECR